MEMQQLVWLLIFMAASAVIVAVVISLTSNPESAGQSAWVDIIHSWIS